VLLLPAHDLVLGEVADVRATRLAARLEEHPADVGVPEPLLCVVWVEFGVGVAMMCTVATRPPLDWAL
jgi:hypothetical protein